MREAAEIAGFGDGGVGNGLLDAAESEQRLSELLLEPIAPTFARADGVDEFMQDDPLRRARQYELGEPAAVSGVPSGAAGVADVAAEQERIQALFR